MLDRVNDVPLVRGYTVVCMSMHRHITLFQTDAKRALLSAGGRHDMHPATPSEGTHPLWTQIGEISADVASHLAESGEDIVEAFGPPDAYAEHRAASLERGAAAGDAFQRRTFRATAVDEIGILAVAGQEGWELVEMGALALFCQHPRDLGLVQHWEYRRRVGIKRDALVAAMQAAGGEPCGLWLPFHNVKRPVARAATATRCGGGRRASPA